MKLEFVERAFGIGASAFAEAIALMRKSLNYRLLDVRVRQPSWTPSVMTDLCNRALLEPIPLAAGVRAEVLSCYKAADSLMCTRS